MPLILSISPFRCRMWDYHDRLETQLNEQRCRAEIDSIARHGQLVPVLGRRLSNDPDYDVELIFGSRRLFVARHLNMPLRVELRELGDREALAAMDIENRLRQDISPYERGVSYARWLRAGHFKSQDDIARALRVSGSQVSRLLKLAHLPAIVIDAFGDPVNICETWGLDLMEALEDSSRRQPTLRRAREIASGKDRPPARDVYQQLLAIRAGVRKLVAKTRDDVIKDNFGNPLFRMRRLRGAVSLILPIERLSGDSVQRVCRAVAEVLSASASERNEVSHPRVRRRGPAPISPLGAEVL